MERKNRKGEKREENIKSQTVQIYFTQLLDEIPNSLNIIQIICCYNGGKHVDRGTQDAGVLKHREELTVRES